MSMMNVPSISSQPAKEKSNFKFSVEMLGHATIILNFADIKILCDPHLMPNFGHGYFAYNPSREINIESLPNFDAVILSHAHRDHFDIMSLEKLNKKTPIFFPHDLRIEHTLQKLGFESMLSVTDWTTIQPFNNFTILWTPSTYKVPENGIAFKYHDFVIWNLVDSIVQKNWIEETLARLNVDKIDMLLTGCQPLIETDILEAKQPKIFEDTRERCIELINAVCPQYIIPVADGHYCDNLAKWMNHQKFPYSDELVSNIMRINNAKVIWLNPGEIFGLSHDNKFLHEKIKNSYVQRKETNNRDFHPGGWILPLFSQSSIPYWQDLINILKNQMVLNAQNFVGQIFDEKLFNFRCLSCNYQFTFINENSELLTSIQFIINEQGNMSLTNFSNEPNIEMCIPMDVFAGILCGDLYFTTAYLGGRLREYYKNIQEKMFIVSNTHVPIPDDHDIALSGILVFNRLISLLPDTYLKALDNEIDIAKKFRENINYTYSNNKDEITKETVPNFLGNLGENPTLWHFLSQLIQLYRDPSEHSGCITGSEKIWYGFLGQSTWQIPSDEERNTCDFHIIPYSLLEAQPHLGDGVRFPERNYKILINNIINTKVKKWIWDTRLPRTNLKIPTWRFASLLPISHEMLIKDLKKLGWKGEIITTSKLDDIQPYCKYWWLGVPKLFGTLDEIPISYKYKELIIPGAINLAIHNKSKNENILYSNNTFQTPKFRFEGNFHGRNYNHLAELLIEAPVRFSWLCSEEETIKVLNFNKNENSDLLINNFRLSLIQYFSQNHAFHTKLE